MTRGRRLGRAVLLAAACTPLVMAGPSPRADVPTPAPTSAPAPRIAVEPGAFDFGTLRPGKAVDKEFLVRNYGRAELRIQSITTSCGCTAALADSKTIKPGGSTPLRVTLTAPDERGPLVKTVLIQSNDPVRPRLEVKIEASVAGRRAGR